MFIKGVQSITYKSHLKLVKAQLLTQPPWAYHTPLIYSGVKIMAKIQETNNNIMAGVRRVHSTFEYASSLTD